MDFASVNYTHFVISLWSTRFYSTIYYLIWGLIASVCWWVCQRNTLSMISVWASQFHMNQTAWDQKAIISRTSSMQASSNICRSHELPRTETKSGSASAAEHDFILLSKTYGIEKWRMSKCVNYKKYRRYFVLRLWIVLWLCVWVRERENMFLSSCKYLLSSIHCIAYSNNFISSSASFSVALSVAFAIL